MINEFQTDKCLKASYKRRETDPGLFRAMYHFPSQFIHHKYLDRCFATFFSRCPKKYEWETVTQNVEEFTSRYLSCPARPARRVGRHPRAPGDSQSRPAGHRRDTARYAPQSA